MNNTYRLVWNATLGLWQAAPETAKGQGKSKSSRALRPLLASAAFALASSAFGAPVLPTGGNVVAGNGTITQSGNTTTIDQGSSKLAIDWQSFSIGQGGTVVFRQPSTDAVALNRVLGSDPSLIQGALRANGQVFLLNPNGVLFSPTAQVDTGGLLATTLDMKTADFLDGRYLLEGASANAVVNQGALRVAAGGTVALVAARVTNAGGIDAPEGNVLLGGASEVLLDLGGPVKLQLQKASVDTLVENGGAIRADGGTVLLTARAASELAGSAINQGGTIRAQTLATGKQGQILLLGDMAHGELTVGGTLDASAPASGNGGFIETSAAHVTTQDGLHVTAGAARGKGGEWLVDPYDYVINATAANNIVSSLNTGTSVTITTQSSVPQYGALATMGGDITVGSAINKSAGGDATLTLRADRNVIVNADVGASAGKLGVTLSAGNGGGTYGGVRVNANLKSNGGDILIGGARGTSNQGIAYATNLNDSEAAVVIEQNRSILSGGGNITINGRSTVGSNNGNYSGETGGVYVKSGATILSGTGDLFITGESSGGIKTFGIAFEANAGTKTVVGSATNGGNMLMNAVNTSAGTAAERDEGAMGLVNNGSTDRLSFYGPSVASWLVFINGVPQLSGYTRAPQLKCVDGYLNCGYLVVPGSNNSYLYAGYQSVDMATRAAYVIQSGAGTKVYDGSTLATNLTLNALGGPAGFSPASLQPAPLFHTPSKNAGLYTRLVRDAANPKTLVAGGETYAVGYFNSGTYQITPRALTPTVTSKVYDGTGTAAVTASGVIGSDDVRLQGSGSFGGSTIGQYSNVSASGITLSGTDARNYTLGSNTVAGMSASILPREVTLNAQKTYDGTNDLTGVLVIGNLVAGEQLNYSGAAANSLHAGEAAYVSALTLLDGGNGVAANYVLPSLAGASNANRALIAPRVLDVSTGGAAGKTYDGTTAAPAGFQPVFSVTGLAAADAGALVSVGATGAAYNSARVPEANRLVVSGMSVTGVSGGVAHASDYVLATNTQNIAAHIDARPLSIAANDAAKVYGDTDPQLGYRITAGSLVSGDSLSGQLARNAGENVGSYAIDASGLNNPNYAVSVTGGALTVTPRAITVTANDAGKTYGDRDPQLGYRISAGSLVGGDTLSGSVLRAAGENVGSYAIDASSLANGNYLVTVQNGTLTVTPRALSVMFDPLAKIYGDADPTLAYRITAGSLANGDSLDVTRLAGENVGSYAVTAGASPNYILSSTPGVLTISPRALTVAVDNAAKTYGESDPTLGYRIVSGNLVGSDRLGGTMVRAGGEDAGSYAVDGSGLANGNYVLTVNNGTLTIAPRAISVSADSVVKTVGDADPQLTWRLTGGSLAGNDTLAGQLARAAGESAGSYAIGQGTLGNRNYAIGFSGAALQIAAAPAVPQPVAPVVVEQPVVPAPVAVPPGAVVPAPAAPPAPVIAPPALARTAIAAPFTNIVPELVPPTVGALSYVPVAERMDSGSGKADEAEGQSLDRAASHAPTSGRDVKFLDVMVVGGGINTGAGTTQDAPAN
jgi:filamentous hemagglutinin family protein